MTTELINKFGSPEAAAEKLEGINIMDLKPFFEEQETQPVKKARALRHFNAIRRGVSPNPSKSKFTSLGELGSLRNEQILKRGVKYVGPECINHFNRAVIAYLAN